MYNVLKLNDISDLIFNSLDAKYTVTKDAVDPDAVLVRSAAMADYVIGDNLKCVARAGAGVNNIPLPKMTAAGVVVFNTPGANANAVKELVIAALLISCRDIVGGVNWTTGTLAGNADAPKLVESGKKQFIGSEIYGKTLGVIGLGAIGAMVASSAISLGMSVVGYDPFLTAEKAKAINADISFTADLNEVFAKSDFITLHVPFTDTTKGIINAASIAKMKNGVKIINAARGELVNNADIISALNSGAVAKYVTDFPMTEVIAVHKNIITIPHLGASTPEAEDNCAVMAAKELKDYIEDGIIINSVNYPTVNVKRTSNCRTTILTSELAESVQIATEVLSKYEINAVNSAAKGTAGYIVIDTAKVPTAEDVKALAAKAIKVRIIQ